MSKRKVCPNFVHGCVHADHRLSRTASSPDHGSSTNGAGNQTDCAKTNRGCTAGAAGGNNRAESILAPASHARCKSPLACQRAHTQSCVCRHRLFLQSVFIAVCYSSSCKRCCNNFADWRHLAPGPGTPHGPGSRSEASADVLVSHKSGFITFLRSQELGLAASLLRHATRSKGKHRI